MVATFDMKLFSHGWSNGFDGPGRRWVLYTHGCNFRCAWCANPEGLAPDDAILFHPDHGNHAEKACPRGAITVSSTASFPRRRESVQSEELGPRLHGDDKQVHPDNMQANISLNRSICRTCMDRPCLNVWKHPAFEQVSFEMSAAEILKKASEYKPLFSSGGGVTFGGGEPTLQADELVPLLSEIRILGINTAVETNASTPAFRSLIGQTDLLICDLKCMDPALHRKWTGCDNDIVLANLSIAAEMQPGLLVRMTLVKGFNDSDAELEAAARFLETMLARRLSLEVEILRMHHLGAHRYRALGIEYGMNENETVASDTVQGFARTLLKRGITASTPGA